MSYTAGAVNNSHENITSNRNIEGIFNILILFVVFFIILSLFYLTRTR